MSAFPLFLGLMPASSEQSGEREQGPYHSVFRLSHNPAVFSMATHFCFSKLLGTWNRDYQVLLYLSRVKFPSLSGLRGVFSANRHVDI